MNKKWNYLIAVLVFITMMILINGSATVIVTMIYMAGAMIYGGSYTGVIYDFIMKYQNVISCAMYLVAAAAFLPWYYCAFIQPVGVDRYVRQETERLKPASFLWILLAAVSIQHLSSFIMLGIQMIFPSAMEAYTELIEMSGVTEYSVSWYISLILLPPLVEETVFRGLIFRYLRKAGTCFWAANLIQAVFFGIFHMNLVQGIYTFFLGLFLGYLTYRYNNLAAPMLLHALFNLFGSLLTDLENRYFPELLITLIIVGSVPVFIFAVTMIQFRIGEKKKNAGEYRK